MFPKPPPRYKLNPCKAFDCGSCICGCQLCDTKVIIIWKGRAKALPLTHPSPTFVDHLCFIGDHLSHHGNQHLPDIADRRRRSGKPKRSILRKYL